MEPLECSDNGTRSMTFIKPVQSGGSVVGEGCICYNVAVKYGGDIQYNWQNDRKADERFIKRIDKILRACKPVMARATSKWNTGLVVFDNCNFTMQGVFTENALASDSIRVQVNEELHDQSMTSGWKDDDALNQAYRRLTAYWNSLVFNISNAGKRGGPLHKAYESGTRQRWVNRCPGCGQWHAMRTRWEDDKPQLGGLRYDGEKNRRPDGTMDYFKLQSSIRFQMPCGYVVHDNVNERRKLSINGNGRYSEPENTGALLIHRSFTLEAVAVDYIPWMTLIQEKEEALKSLKYGKGDAWWTYLRERECQFTSDSDRPVMQPVALTSGTKKNRKGLPGRLRRIAAGDYQHGLAARNELPHWWVVIIDVGQTHDGKLHILLVYEGRVYTDEDLADVLKQHEVPPSCVALDSGWNSKHVYMLCMKYGYYAFKDESTALFAGHDDGSRKIYSPAKPLHSMINVPPKFDYVRVGEQVYPNPDEPMFMHVSKTGMMDRLAWLRGTPELCLFEVPEDVSEDFKAHMDSWQVEEKKKPNSEEVVSIYAQRRHDDHLFKCMCYISVLMEDFGMFGGLINNEKQD